MGVRHNTNLIEETQDVEKMQGKGTMGRKIIIIRCLRPEDIVSMEAWRLVAMGNQALGMRDEDACSLRRKRCSPREEGQVGLDAIVSKSLVLHARVNVIQLGSCRAALWHMLQLEVPLVYCILLQLSSINQQTRLYLISISLYTFTNFVYCN